MRADAPWTLFLLMAKTMKQRRARKRSKLQRDRKKEGEGEKKGWAGEMGDEAEKRRREDKIEQL